MGQLTSSEVSNAPQNEFFSVQEIKSLFQTRAASLLSKGEAQAIASKVNMGDIGESDAVLTYSDLAIILSLSNEKEADSSGTITLEDDRDNHLDEQSEIEIRVESPVSPVIQILHRSFTILGRLPFLANAPPQMEQLTIKKLIVALAVHLGSMPKIWHSSDYLKMLFISLALTPILVPENDTHEKSKTAGEDIRPTSVGTHDEKSKSEVGSSEESDSKNPVKSVSVGVRQLLNPTEDRATVSHKINWDSLECLCNYDGLDIDELSVSAYDLLQLFTLLLIVNLVPEQSHIKMLVQVSKLAFEKWKLFEAASLSLLRYFDTRITHANCKAIRIPYETFRSGVEGAMDGFIEKNFKRLLQTSLLLSMLQLSSPKDSTDERKRKSPRIFKPTRLVDEATISLLNLFAKNINSNLEITLQNMVELYIGAQSGFSTRSLELKIFKWKAPTIILVSGKRLKSKTITKNKRYQKFDAEYPRYFRSSEDPRKSWQQENDKITYAVFVKQPWKNSNKRNFGDEETAIMTILPRLDFFKSKKGLITNGELIYFNNQGMGIGIGNDQPVNKNNTRKHIPGSVSLTIEANLEFAVFRHIFNAGANTPHYFETSSQKTVCSEDYEDRFVITDLEVWGVGSMKELDEQRKQWEWEEKQALARQTVNLRNLGEERAFLEMVGLVGKQGSGGSV